MFYHLLYPLVHIHPIFNVFRYITFRAAYATVTALLISFLLGPRMIEWLRRHQVVESVRADVPERHLQKRGTPTMGGILVIVSTVVPTLLWADLGVSYIRLVLIATVWMGIIGAWDDYLKSVRGLDSGLIGRYKLIGQVGLGLLLGIILTLFPEQEDIVTKTTLPFFKGVYVDLGWLYIPFIVLVITGATNAVNLADGLDGLAIGLTAFAAFAFAGFAYLHGHALFSRYLQILSIPGSGELTIFCMSLVGASMGFLWFNSHRAEVFMGDTGSLAIGGALATLAILLKSEFILFIVGGVFVAEAMSVIIQVASFRWRGRRVFRMAPLHHHFELLGWNESKIVTRFYILAAICALIGLSTLKIR